jgi:membrane protein
MSGTRWSDLLARGRGRSGLVLEWADATVIGRTWQRLLEIEFVDRSVALAAKGFVSLFPLLVVATAITPDAVRRSILDELSSRFGLSGESFDLVRDAFARPDQIKAATGLLGLLLTVLYAVSFTTALQRAYLRAWRRPSRGGLRDKGRGLAWLAGILAFIAVLGAVTRVLSGPPGTVATLLAGLGASSALWWWTAHTMLRGQVRWRPLLPGALLTGVGGGVYAAAASVWMPRVLENNVRQFGFVGVALSFVTWFVGFSFLIVLATAVGPPLCEGDGAVARWLRGPDDDVLVTGAAPALPAPASPPRLRDLIGGAEDP